MSNYDSSALAPMIEKQRFESIDIMRGIAILMVILVHTAQKIEGDMFLRLISRYGQMGVQLFFIASAFTLCYSIEIMRSRYEPLINFYIRRYFRIAPGYYVGFLVYFTLYAILHKLNIPYVWKGNVDPVDVLVNALFLHGLYPPANNNVVPGGWSIGTEMLFYFIFPLLYNMYKSLQAKFRNSYLIVPFIALALSMLIQYLILWATHKPVLFKNNGFIYFSILNQLPVFFVGLSLYFAHQNKLLERIHFSISLALFIGLSFLSGYLMIKGASLFIFIHALTPFIAALSFVFLFVLLQYAVKLKGKLFAKIGILSYSCYLLHFVFAHSLTDYLADRMKLMKPDLLLILLYPLTVALTCLCAAVMYRYVELKGIRLGKHIIETLHVRKQPKPNNLSS